LDRYDKEFSITPIFIAEYHQPNNPDTRLDLSKLLHLARTSPLLLGLNFFEFQNRRDEAGHSTFGIFDPAQGLANRVMDFHGTSFRVPCLSPVRETGANQSLAEQIIAAYGGAGVDFTKTCPPDPEIAAISRHGFDQVQGLRDNAAMDTYIRRVVQRMGGDVPGKVPAVFAKEFAHSQATFKALSWALELHPTWAEWSRLAACVVDKDSLKSEVARKVNYVCGLEVADCSNIPADCQGDVWNTASWVFGSHFETLAHAQGDVPSPFQDCYFAGSARFTSPELYRSLGLPKACVLPVGFVAPQAERAMVTNRSFKKVSATGSVSAMAVFLRRMVRRMGGDVQGDVPLAIAQTYTLNNVSFEDATSALAQHPAWATWSSRAACVPYPNAKVKDLDHALSYVCGLGTINCAASMPEACKANARDQASFAFGSHFRTLMQNSSQGPNPLTGCFFEGTAGFMSWDVYKNFTLNPACVVAVDVVVHK